MPNKTITFHLEKLPKVELTIKQSPSTYKWEVFEEFDSDAVIATFHFKAHAKAFIAAVRQDGAFAILWRYCLEDFTGGPPCETITTDVCPVDGIMDSRIDVLNAAGLLSESDPPNEKQIYQPVKLGIVSVLYDDKNSNTYEGVKAFVKLGAKKVKEQVFNTKDPTKDYWMACLWLAFVERWDTTMLGSSCDHFNMDGGSIKWESDEEYVFAVGKELKKLYPGPSKK